MPQQKWVIKDTVTGLFLTGYSTTVEFCSWGTNNPLEWDTEAETTAVIETWGDTEGRFIGTHPRPH